MKANATFSQIASQLVTIFRNEGKTASYNSANEMREVFCGWCGTMSPMSRPAFVADFGADVVEEAEKEARRIIAEDAQKYAKSEYFAHVQEAESHAKAGQPTPKTGAFIYGICSGLKCDGGHGIFEEISNKIDYAESERQTLVFVEKVYNVTAGEFGDPKTADTLAAREDCPGGWSEEDGGYLDAEQMHWTHAAAVVAPDGRYYLIDCEGYDYARYIYTPINWRAMFADIANKYEAEKREREEKEQREQAEAAAARRSRYESKCRKWAKHMTEVAEYAEAEEKAIQANGWRSEEAKAARRKLHSVRRGNILAMCRAAFPGVKFSLKKNDGWGAAILDGIIKDNDARKRAERDKEQAYRERIEECDANLRSSKGKEAREKCQREKTLAVRAYMRYCRRTEAHLSHQQGRRAARKLQKLLKNRAEWWEANTGQAHPY